MADLEAIIFILKKLEHYCYAAAKLGKLFLRRWRSYVRNFSKFSKFLLIFGIPLIIIKF